MTENPEKTAPSRRRSRRRRGGRGGGRSQQQRPQGPQRNIIAYMPDMFFGLKVGDTAKKMGYRCYFLREVELFEDKLQELRPDLVVIDTAADKQTWTSLVRMAHQMEHGLYPVIAIGRHTDLDARAAALECGAHDFIANSRFFPDMPKVFEKYARTPTESELAAAQREFDAARQPAEPAEQESGEEDEGEGEEDETDERDERDVEAER